MSKKQSRQPWILFCDENNLFVIDPEESMAGKKGAIPSHVKSRSFFHPESDHPCIQALEDIEDPRKLFNMMIAMEIGEDEKAILAALRSSLKLKACILEMVDITDGDAFEKLNNGDDVLA